jgi:hypothetical protein
MRFLNEQTAAKPAGLLPASLVDSQLDHFDRIVRYLTREDPANASRGLDHEYWGKRIGALVEKHDLVPAQRCRVLQLLDLLERTEVLKMRGRTAA